MTGLDPSWATNEPHAALFTEQITNAAVNIGAMAYGVHLATFFTCAYCLWHSKRWNQFFSFYAIYSFVLLVLATTNIACNIHFDELQWIDERNYPGGPLMFSEQQQALPVHTLGDAAANTVTFLVDSLLIYRCYVVWKGNLAIIVLPILILISSTVMSILRTVAAAQPTSDGLFSSAAVRFGTPYWALSLSLNMLVTLLIVTRIFMARSELRRTMGEEYGRAYTGVAAMLVESALPYSVVSLILIILYARGNTGEIIFIPMLPQVQCIAPELIIIRVIRGHAWSKTTFDTPTIPAMRFRTPRDVTSASSRTEKSSIPDRGGLTTHPALPMTSMSDFDSRNTHISSVKFKDLSASRLSVFEAAPRRSNESPVEQV